jgi:hypothetical protein
MRYEKNIKNHDRSTLSPLMPATPDGARSSQAPDRRNVLSHVGVALQDPARLSRRGIARMLLPQTAKSEAP